MFYQIFLSPQVKRSAIITYKHGIYELTYELPNDIIFFEPLFIYVTSKFKLTDTDIGSPSKQFPDTLGAISPRTTLSDPLLSMHLITVMTE